MSALSVERRAALQHCLAFVGRRVSIRIDRPLGSRHPRFPSLICPLNYGYAPGTRAPDGMAIDAYVHGVDRAIAVFAGRCVALMHRRDDVEDKLVVAPDAMARRDDALDDAAIRAATAFQERFFDSVVLR